MIVFSAVWSGSTHMMNTYVRQLASREANCEHALLDIEECPNLASYFGISQIPVIVLLKNREIKDYIRGTISKKKLGARVARLR